MDLTEIKQWGACMCLALETEVQYRIHSLLDHWLLTSREFFNERKEHSFFWFFSLFLKSRFFCGLTWVCCSCVGFFWFGPAGTQQTQLLTVCAALASNGRWQHTAGGRFFQREELQIVKGNCGSATSEGQSCVYLCYGKIRIKFQEE